MFGYCFLVVSSRLLFDTNWFLILKTMIFYMNYWLKINLWIKRSPTFGFLHRRICQDKIIANYTPHWNLLNELGSYFNMIFSFVTVLSNVACVQLSHTYLVIYSPDCAVHCCLWARNHSIKFMYLQKIQLNSPVQFDFSTLFITSVTTRMNRMKYISKPQLTRKNTLKVGPYSTFQWLRTFDPAFCAHFWTDLLF